jgi:hypothetical protein
MTGPSKDPDHGRAWIGRLLRPFAEVKPHELLELLTPPLARPASGPRLGPEDRRRFLADLLTGPSVIVRLLTARLASENGWLDALPSLHSAAIELAGEELQILLAAAASLQRTEAHAHG